MGQMTAQELIEALEGLAPASYAEGWDNSGLLVGDRSREIKKVYIALDADTQVIKAAADLGCDMLITHHPLIFSPMRQITADDFIGRRVIGLIEHHMNYYAMHTTFDAAVMGEICAARLKLKVLSPLQPLEDPDLRKTAPMAGIGCVGETEEEITLEGLAGMIRKRFDLPQVRFYGHPDRMIRHIAMCPGSGKGLAELAVSSGADVYVTGDIDHHLALDLLEQGLASIDAGHHGLEHIFVDFMLGWFSDNHPDIKCYAADNRSPFSVI